MHRRSLNKMGTPRYGDYLILCTGCFALGVGIGWSRRTLSRSHRMKSTAILTSIIATLPVHGILILALSTLAADGNPFRSFRDVFSFLGELAMTFIWGMGYFGIPVVVGSAVAKPRHDPTSEQDAAGQPATRPESQ